MVFTVKRSFPWFPLVLAIGWMLMMSLAVRDLAWFAAAAASFRGQGSLTATQGIAPVAPTKDVRWCSALDCSYDCSCCSQPSMSTRARAKSTGREAGL